MIRATLSALMSHWWRNPLQLVTLLGGLALATALWSGVQAINAEARRSYDFAAAALGEGDFAQITGALKIEDFVRLRRAGVLVSPVVEGRINGVRLIGLEPLTAPRGLMPQGRDGQSMGGAEEMALYGSQAALDAIGEIETYPKVLTVGQASNTVFTDISVAAKLLSRADSLDRLIVLERQPKGALDPVSLGYTVTPPRGGTDIAQLTDSFHLNLTAFGLLSFAVGIFIVNGAIGLAFEQRRPVIRTLRALGVPLRTLVGLMVAELFLLATLAGALGIALGYLIAAALLPDVAATLRGLYGAEVGGALSLDPMWWLSGFAIAVLGAMIAALGAFATLLRMPMLAASQARAWSMVSARGARARHILAAALTMTALAALEFGGGLVSGFVLLGAMLIAAALLLPSIISIVLRIGERLARRVVPQWFWADTRQQISGLSLALMALLLAMAANVGVSTMVSSFRVTFVEFLDQRLAAEVYVSTNDPAAAAAFEGFVTGKADAVLPIINETVTVEGLPVELYGARDHATYPDNWRLLEGVEQPWAQVALGADVLVNEQFARRSGLWTGATITIAGEFFGIAGVYGDYGNPIGQIVMNEHVFETLFPESRALRFGLRVPPEDVAALRATLIEFGVPEENILNQSALKAMSIGIFERTFKVTGALNVLTLAVAGFAILMSLLTLATMRLPQVAPVWALGMTRADLARLELWRAILLAAITSVTAIPLGLALAWVLLSVVNVEAFGWQLPMFLFPSQYGWLVVQALCASLVAAVIPSLRLRRTPPSQLLKVFSNER